MNWERQPQSQSFWNPSVQVSYALRFIAHIISLRLQFVPLWEFCKPWFVSQLVQQLEPVAHFYIYISKYQKSFNNVIFLMH